MVDLRNNVIQARNATIYVEKDNIASLISELTHIRSNWSVILQECELVASNLGWRASFPEERRTRSNVPNVSLEDHFKIFTFYVILDSVIASITHRFKAITEIYENFCFSWNYVNIENEELLKASAKKFPIVIFLLIIIDEIVLLKSIHSSNIRQPLTPLTLVNKL